MNSERTITPMGHRHAESADGGMFMVAVVVIVAGIVACVTAAYLLAVWL